MTMENVEDVDTDQILQAAGIEDVSSLNSDERKKIMNVLKVSTQEQFTSSPSLDTRKESSTRISEQERDDHFESIKSKGNLFDPKTFDSKFSNHGNTNHYVEDKDVSKPLATNSINYANALASSPKAGSSRPYKAETKPAPGAAVTTRDTIQSSNNTYHPGQNKSNESGWLSKENSAPSTQKKQYPRKEEAKPKEPEDNIEEDCVNNSVDNCDDRDSPEIVEEVQKPLMHFLFEKRKSTLLHALSSECSLPPMCIPKEEWVHKVGQLFFARKAAKIRAEASRANWVTVAERNYSLMFLEQAISRSSPSHNKDDVSSNFTENRNMDVEKSPKATTLSDNVVDGARESSPDVAVVDNSPKRDTIKSDAGDNAAIALADTSKKYGKNDTRQSGPSGRGADDGNQEAEQSRKRNTRSRGARRRSNGKLAIQKSESTSINEDNSNGAESSSTAKNNEKEFAHNNANYSPMEGSPHNDNNIEDEQTPCPMCAKLFPRDVVQSHAWECQGTQEKEEDQLVAERGDNGHGVDFAEPKQRDQYSCKDNDESDSDEEFTIRKIRPPITRKRNIFLTSEDEERPTKTSRK